MKWTTSNGGIRFELLNLEFSRPYIRRGPREQGAIRCLIWHEISKFRVDVEPALNDTISRQLRVYKTRRAAFYTSHSRYAGQVLVTLVDTLVYHTEVSSTVLGAFLSQSVDLDLGLSDVLRIHILGYKLLDRVSQIRAGSQCLTAHETLNALVLRWFPRARLCLV